MIRLKSWNHTDGTSVVDPSFESRIPAAECVYFHMVAHLILSVFFFWLLLMINTFLSYLFEFRLIWILTQIASMINCGSNNGSNLKSAGITPGFCTLIFCFMFSNLIDVQLSKTERVKKLKMDDFFWRYNLWMQKKQKKQFEIESWFYQSEAIFQNTKRWLKWKQHGLVEIS